jgi:hypothetical protein
MAISIKSISDDAVRLIQQCEETTPQIQTVRRVDELVQRHQELKIQYDALIRGHDELWGRLASSDDESCGELSEIFDRVKLTWKRFEDELLTQFPQAQIDYGRTLVGSIEPSADLPIDRELKIQFPHQQGVRADGNCFYTSFALNYLKWLCRNPAQFETPMQRILEMPNFPGKEEAIQLLMDLKENLQSLDSCIRSNSNMFVIISFLRHCAAYYMTNVNRDWIESYLPESAEDPATAEQFVTDHVLKMGRHAHAYEIQAILSYLGCQLWIIDDHNGLRKMNEESASFVGAVYRASAANHYSSLQTDSRDPISRIAGRVAGYTLPILTATTSVILGYLVYRS